ncbi:FAD-dependent oxidoreductase [Phreatobacter stygius]|uniref:FAD-dependent monooxygenase n=1 Tax=Phreatobacter stygius TaxID=1940610 RepID=A0A4D7AUC9_9HYPH|nr:NAD(P)/FAD-dependent oxidoreductase [Phreatobacter stygius]QCI63231.1 FAD-dependent monooxygenase [Phreatobacter stygius]
MGDPPRKVAIAGAGVAGLAAALAFRKAGYAVTVLERTAELGAVGAGILLQANGLLVLETFGVAEEVRAAGAAMSRFLMRDRRGRALLATELQAHLPPNLWPVCIHRADLHDILWRACAARGVTLRLGCKVSAVETDGPSPVLVYDTPSGAARLAGDLVVGADGVNSAVRDLAGFACRFWPVVEGSVQGVARFAVPADCHGEYIGGAEACGMLPLGGAKTFWFWGGSGQTVGKIETLSFATWKESVCRDFPPMRLVLDERHDWPGTVRLQHQSVQCDAWSAGKVVLIGDAAHAMSPNLGQGANCALVDALALVSRVAARDAGANLADALARFEHDRRAMVERLQRQGQRRAVASAQSWPGLEPIVNFALRLVRFAPLAMRRAEVRLMNGLEGDDLDLRAAGIRAAIPW